MHTPERVAQLMGGTAWREDLVRLAGVHALRKSAAAGRLLRLRRGLYMLPPLPAAELAAAATGGVLSQASAAAIWELPMVAGPTAVHLTVRPSAHPEAVEDVRFHYARLAGTDVFHRGPGVAVTSPLRTVLDCAASLPFREGLAVADSALRLGRIDAGQLRQVACARRGHGSAAALRVARLASALAANPFESALRGICLDAGLNGFEPQVQVRDAGVNYYLDLADRRRLLALEADSFEHHGHRKALHADCTRHNELGRRGWLVLRFSWEHVMFEPEWVLAVVRDTLQCRRIRPGR
ncbi:DUF559 domain-containing protein [Paenarthrobacter sp. DKR-5]|uniref:endonuclease domain-containing protein n=1 Tax=Paenarthrobacter sp. DKR-5 TaxID=2835535 RepID=UPI001BDC6660|nr:DUF559 domain-containing protein [Paenarthrobacter sp. DKR-5]MBT1003206.1 DUF559 domain-containing protein [Paenarthrobacter sp. DKR-5]